MTAPTATTAAPSTTTVQAAKPTKVSRPNVEQRLTLARVALTNAQANPEIQAALQTFGYTTERIEQGEMLYEAAQTQYQQKITAYGGLRTAADALSSAEQQAQATYTRHVKIARVALEDDRGALQALRLQGKRKMNMAGWLAQAQHFYAVALADVAIQRKLADFSLTRTVLQEGARQVEAVATGNATRSQQRGVAQDATRVRNKAITALDKWMSDFRTIARVALKDRPQMLEQLGITVRS